LKIQWKNLAIAISRHEKSIKRRKTKLIGFVAAKRKIFTNFLNIPLGTPIEGSRNST
jgi:hypothetical protein